MNLRTIPMVLALFLSHCAAADEDGPAPLEAAGDRPATGGGETPNGAEPGAAAGNAGTASDGTPAPALLPFSPKSDCDAPVEVNGPQSSAWTRRTARELSLARTTTSLAHFVWQTVPTSTGTGTRQVTRLGASGWHLSNIVGTGRPLVATAGNDLLTAVVSSTLQVTRDSGTPFFTGDTVTLNSSGTSAALEMGPAGHGAFAWHDGAAIHVARVAPGASAASVLPAIAGRNPSNNDYIALTLDANGDGFVFFRRQDGQLAVRGWVGASWAGAAVTLPGTSYGMHMSKPVALPGRSAFTAVRTLHSTAVSVGIVNGATTVTADSFVGGGSTEDMMAFASADGELTVVGARGNGTVGGREVYGTRRPAGGAWSTTTLSPSIASPLRPAAAIDARGDVTVAYRTASGVEHRRLAKGATTWEPAVKIAPSLAIDNTLEVQVAIDPKTGDPLVGVGARSAAGTTTLYSVRCH